MWDGSWFDKYGGGKGSTRKIKSSAYIEKSIRNTEKKRKGWKEKKEYRNYFAVLQNVQIKKNSM